MDTPSQKSTEVQLQHSGDLGLEQPQVHYDNTSLPEAFEKHLTDTEGNVIVPNTIADVAYETEAPKKSRKGLTIGLGAVGLVVAAGAIFGVNALNQPPKNEPVATAPADPGEATAPSAQETNAPVAEVQPIPAGLDDEAYAERFVSILDQWIKAGSEDIDQLNDEFLGSSGTQEDFWKSVAEKNAPEFINKVFGGDWKSNLETKDVVEKFIEGQIKANATYLQLRAMTKFSPDKAVDIEPYEQQIAVKSVSVTNSDEQGRTLEITYSTEDNGELNRAEDAPSPDGIITITTAVQDTSEVVVKVS